MKKINLLFVFFLMIGSLNAQRLINLTEDQETALSTEERSAFENFKQQESIQNPLFIQMGNLKELISEEYITFNLPNTDESYKMKITDSGELSDEKNYSYSAEEQENEETIGNHATLVSIDGYISGALFLSGKFYQIFPINERLQLLYEMQPKEGSFCESNTERQTPEQNAECKMGSKGCSTNILILYTKSSLNSLPTGYNTSNSSLLSLANLLITQTNKSFSNSKIMHRVTLAGMELLPDPALNSGAYKEKDYYAGLLTTTSKTSTLRIAKKADLLVILTAGTYYGSTVGVTPVNAPTNLNLAFSLVQMSQSNNDFTFVHEVGHLFGADHDKDSHPPGVSPARGYKTTKKAATIMCYKPFDTRIQYFSHSTIKVSGEVIGTKDDFNACVIQKNGCAISNLIK